MLLNNNKQFFKLSSKKQFFDFDNCFFVFSIFDNEQLNLLFDFFGFGNVFHVSFLKKIFVKNEIMSIFSGPVYFCFVDKIDYFFFQSFISSKEMASFSLMGLCYDKFFLNYTLNYSNILNVIYSNMFIIFYIFFFNFFIYLMNVLYILEKKCLEKH